MAPLLWLAMLRSPILVLLALLWLDLLSSLDERWLMTILHSRSHAIQVGFIRLRIGLESHPLLRELLGYLLSVSNARWILLEQLSDSSFRKIGIIFLWVLLHWGIIGRWLGGWRVATILMTIASTILQARHMAVSVRLVSIIRGLGRRVNISDVHIGLLDFVLVVGKSHVLESLLDLTTGLLHDVHWLRGLLNDLWP